MNSFDYWFDYIVRNGVFNPGVISSYWELKINKAEYKAFFCDQYSIEKEEITFSKCIMVIYSNESYPDSRLSSFFYKDNFDINHFTWGNLFLKN